MRTGIASRATLGPHLSDRPRRTTPASLNLLPGPADSCGTTCEKKRDHPIDTIQRELNKRALANGQRRSSSVEHQSAAGRPTQIGSPHRSSLRCGWPRRISRNNPAQSSHQTTVPRPSTRSVTNPACLTSNMAHPRPPADCHADPGTGPATDSLTPCRGKCFNASRAGGVRNRAERKARTVHPPGFA
jgi:hypothetical protein